MIYFHKKLFYDIGFGKRKIQLRLNKELIIIMIMIVLITHITNSIMILSGVSGFAYAQDNNLENKSQSTATHTNEGPVIKDPHLKVELVYRGGITFPVSMAFLSQNDILVLEKNNGTVKRIINGTMLKKPLFSADILNENERGMLGITVTKNVTQKEPKTYIFLYYTENDTKGKAVNHLYRYELTSNRLVNPKLLMTLPAVPGTRHNGGVVTIGPDNYVYVPIGDVNKIISEATNEKEIKADGSAGILRVTQDGKPVGNGILGNKYPLNLYYSYGIRNSFGITFDPVTKNLWDTENGEYSDDEINLVQPGSNGGWNKVQGIWSPSEKTKNSSRGPDGLVDFGGKGKYRDPQFDWKQTVGPTAIKFLNSDKYGKEYQNDIFVADYNYGNIYHFDLNKNRTHLSLKGPLADKIANNTGELQDVIFGTGFGAITHFEIGPDGYLYILSLYDAKEKCDPNINFDECFDFNADVGGSIFRIVPRN
jgi:glucose/arabinose dehydrogenase